MTLAEAGEILAYWAECPPAYLMLQAIARMLGWAPAPVETAPRLLDTFAAAPPPGFALVRVGDTGMPPPVLDPEPLRARNRARAAARQTGDAR